MNIFQNSRGIWRYDIPAGDSPTGRRLRGSTGTKDRQIANQFVHQLLSGKTVEATKGMTLRQACNRALKETWGQAKSPAFFEDGCDVLCGILGGTTQLQDITRDSIRLIKQRLADRGNAPSTINRRLAVLRKLLREAHEEWEVIPGVPPIRLLKESTGRTRTYSREEQEAQLAWAQENNPELYRLLHFLYATGCRVSEALNMNPQRDLLDDRVIFRETKNSAPRTLPISSHTRYYVRNGFNFYDSNAVGKAFRVMRNSLGYRTDSEYVAHTIRHTVATRLFQEGWESPKVMLWMGHKQISTTIRYTHLSSGHLEGGLEILEPEAETVTKTMTNPSSERDDTGDNLLNSGSFNRLLIIRSAVRARPGEPKDDEDLDEDQ